MEASTSPSCRREAGQSICQVSIPIRRGEDITLRRGPRCLRGLFFSQPRACLR
jgi:hypothetical protein